MPPHQYPPLKKSVKSIETVQWRDSKRPAAYLGTAPMVRLSVVNKKCRLFGHNPGTCRAQALWQRQSLSIGLFLECARPLFCLSPYGVFMAIKK